MGRGRGVGRGGRGWDSPRLARSPGPSQEADPPIRGPHRVLCQLQKVCAGPITPKGPPTPQHLPVHLWESEGPHRRGPQPKGWATFRSPREHPLLMPPSTATCKSPFTWPLALHPLCTVRSHGSLPHFTGEGATPREGTAGPCLLPPWYPPHRAPCMVPSTAQRPEANALSSPGAGLPAL